MDFSPFPRPPVWSLLGIGIPEGRAGNLSPVWLVLRTELRGVICGGLVAVAGVWVVAAGVARSGLSLVGWRVLVVAVLGTVLLESC